MMKEAVLALAVMAALVGEGFGQAQSQCFRCDDCRLVDQNLNPPGCEVISCDGSGECDRFTTLVGRGCETDGAIRGAVACVNHLVLYPVPGRPEPAPASGCELIDWGCCTTVCESDNCREEPVMPAPPPQESARRTISTSERLAERVRDAMRLGPDLRASFPPNRILGPGRLLLADGGVYNGPTDARRRSWALSALEVNLTRKDLGVLHGAMNHAAHDHCAQALARRIRVPADGLHWTMLLHINAAGGTLVVDDVDADWAPEVDQTGRACYASMFLGAKVKWPKEESLWVEYPVCLNRGSGRAE